MKDKIAREKIRELVSAINSIETKLDIMTKDIGNESISGIDTWIMNYISNEIKPKYTIKSYMKEINNKIKLLEKYLGITLKETKEEKHYGKVHNVGNKSKKS